MCHRHCIGGDILLVCHVVLQERMIKESCDFWWEPLMASHHPTKSGGLRQRRSGDMFLVVEEQDSTCSRLNQLLLFFFV